MADLIIMMIFVFVMNTQMIFIELMVFIMLITRPDDETRGDETPSA